MLRFALALTLTAAPVWAEIAKPDTLVDTLMALRDALHAQGYPAAEINMRDMNIMVDGTDDGSRVNPDNIHRTLVQAGSDTERQQMMDAFVTSLIGAAAATSDDTPMPTAQVYPILRHTDYVASIGSTSQLVQAPGFGDMIVLYVVDYPDSTASISPDMVSAAGLTDDTLAALALDNLRTKAADLRLEGDSPYYLTLDGYYESSLVLDTDLWTGIAAQIGPLAMMVPARDLVMFAPVDDADALQIMQDVAVDVIEQAPYAISGLVYLWQDGNWVVRD